MFGRVNQALSVLSGRRFILGIVLTIAIGSWLPERAWSQTVTNPQIDFNAAIKPILVTRCYPCHAAEKLSGGVRFDQRAAVAAGGYSGRPLLGGTLKTNEIYRRIASDDPAYRMPKGQPPLSGPEIHLIRSWVEAGTPWTENASASSKNAFADRWLNREAWLNYAETWVNQVPGLIAWLCVMLVLQLGLLFVERFKQAARAQRAWTTKPWARRLAWLQRIGWTQYLLVLTCMSLVLSWQVIAGIQRREQHLAKTLAGYRSAVTDAIKTPAASVYGNPPIPIRPSHPPRLSGTYYRGNCERSPKLFNGGNYRTATLHVALVNGEGRVLQAGDRVQPNDLAIRFELERAVGTTDLLFGDAVTNGVLLTTQVLKESLSPLTEPVERLTVVKPGWKWQATVPLRGPQDGQQSGMSGLIYVYQGTLSGKEARGTVHYGIKYALKFKDFVLEPESEVWLGSLFWSAALEMPHEGKVPLKEWFDDQPIPEMTGENSTDPELLGIPEHRK